VTTHLVVMDENNVEKSKKLEQIKLFKKKPHLVRLDWLLDTMTQGIVMDANLYKFDLAMI